MSNTLIALKPPFVFSAVESQRGKCTRGDREGHQDSTISVFTRDGDGTLRHFYSAHPRMAPDIKERGIDLLAPIWHFMDLTPQGRGAWYTSLDYDIKVRAA